MTRSTRPPAAKTTRKPGASLYYQVYLTLRQRLDSGEYPPDSPIPTEAALAKEFKVSRITVRRAVLDLTAEGRFLRYPGKGTFVSPGAAGTDRNATVYSQLRQTALQAQAKVIDFAYVAASPRVSAKLGLPAATIVQYSRRVRLIKKRPVMLLDEYVPQRLGQHFTRDDLARRPIDECLEAAGAKLASVAQEFSAIAANPEVATLLDVPFGAPLGLVERVVYEQDGSPAQFLIMQYVPELAKLRVQTLAADPGRTESGMFRYA